MAFEQLSQAVLEDDEQFGKYLMDKVKESNPLHKTFLKITLLENLVTTSKNMNHIKSIEEVPDEELPATIDVPSENTVLSARKDYSIKLNPRSNKQENDVQNDKRDVLVEDELEPDMSLTYEHDKDVTRLVDHQYFMAYIKWMVNKNKYKKLINNKVEPIPGPFVARTFRVEKIKGRTMIYEKVRGPESHASLAKGNGPVIRRLPLVASGNMFETTFPEFDKDPDLNQFWEDLKKL